MVSDTTGADASRYDLVMVGSANVDLVVRSERLPGPGETVLGSDLAIHPGGKGANQSVAAARLGARVAFVGRVGSDGHGAFVLDTLRAAGVDVSHVRVADAPTGTALITVDSGGDNTIVVSPGANGRVSPADVEAAGPVLARTSVLCLQMEIPHETVVAAVRAWPAGGRVVVNLAPPAPLPSDVLARCDPLVVNEHEAAYLLRVAGDVEGALDDTSSTLMVARALLELGPRSVVVTLGASGAVAADAGGAEHVPAPRVRAVDTTGAGDAFCGALAVRLAGGWSLLDAVRFATRVGAAAVRATGAQSSFPTLAEVEALHGDADAPNH